MTEFLLQLDQVSAGYVQRGKSQQVIVKPFTEGVPAGKLVCLIGPNGAGKSTLLRTIAGMQTPLSGRVLLDGQDIYQMNPADRAKRLSVVLTQKMEVGLFTGYSLVAMGRHPYTAWSGQLREQDHQVVRQAIRMVGAENLADRAFSTMSDGERQKIMIARALAQEPDMLILDEPTAFLDLPRRVECMVLLRNLAHQMGRTILLSTHDLDLALRCADHIWLLPYSGHMRVGLPEDLVLNGAFEAAFHSANVAFDIETGAFKTQTVGHERIVLEGEGIQYTWVRHALEREGYAVLSKYEAGIPIIRLGVHGADTWQLTIGTETCHGETIDALMTALMQGRVPAL